MKKSKPNTLYWLPLLVGFVLAFGVFLGYVISNDIKDLYYYDQSSESYSHGIGDVEEVLNLLDRKFYRNVEKQALIDDAIYAITNGLDPYTNYISPLNMVGSNESLEDSIQGVGVELFRINDTFYITHLSDDSLLLQKNISIGQALLKVNDVNLLDEGMTFKKIRQEILRKDPVFLTVQTRDGNIHEVSLNKRSLKNDDNDAHFLLNDTIGIIKLSRFNNKSYERFMEYVESLFEGKTSLDLILDVRSNPGGFLSEVMQILQQLFHEKDLVLLSTEGENSRKRVFKSRGNTFFNIDEIVVLVDENSASASEILSGVMQDWDRGVVMGDTTYGKGMVQEQFALKSGGSLRLTTSYYYLPSGRKIQFKFGTNLGDSLEVFKSQKYLRPLNDQSHIIPDVLVSDISSQNCGYSLEQLYHYSFGLKKVETDVESYFSSLKLPSDFIFENSYCQNEALEDLKSILNRRWFGNSNELKRQLLNDPIVINAVDLLKIESDLSTFLRSQKD